MQEVDFRQAREEENRREIVWFIDTACVPSGKRENQLVFVLSVTTWRSRKIASVLTSRKRWLDTQVRFLSIIYTPTTSASLWFFPVQHSLENPDTVVFAVWTVMSYARFCSKRQIPIHVSSSSEWVWHWNNVCIFEIKFVVGAERRIVKILSPFVVMIVETIGPIPMTHV